MIPGDDNLDFVRLGVQPIELRLDFIEEAIL